jgi:hypothetical protein
VYSNRSGAQNVLAVLLWQDVDQSIHSSSSSSTGSNNGSNNSRQHQCPATHWPLHQMAHQIASALICSQGLRCAPARAVQAWKLFQTRASTDNKQQGPSSQRNRTQQHQGNGPPSHLPLHKPADARQLPSSSCREGPVVRLVGGLGDGARVALLGSCRVAGRAANGSSAGSSCSCCWAVCKQEARGSQNSDQGDWMERSAQAALFLLVQRLTKVDQGCLPGKCGFPCDGGQGQGQAPLLTAQEQLRPG